MPLPAKVNELINALDLIPHPEGGFFVETFRSGSTPMSTMGQTGLDCENSDANLVVANGRGENRPDGDDRRNALTSIYWVPTIKSPILLLTCNHSAHVHYYHGGKPFKYSLFDPMTGEFTQVTLGPELHKGQKPQVCVKGGLWKCGIIDGDSDGQCDYEYCLIGEAVAPGFDIHDFNWVTEDQLREKCTDEKQMMHFLNFMSSEIQTVDAAAEFYEDGAAKEQRVKLRA
jgi:predicted cupin superfamily sugar epimerase